MINAVIKLNDKEYNLPIDIEKIFNELKFEVNKLFNENHIKTNDNNINLLSFYVLREYVSEINLSDYINLPDAIFTVPRKTKHYFNNVQEDTYNDLKKTFKNILRIIKSKIKTTSCYTFNTGRILEYLNDVNMPYNKQVTGFISMFLIQLCIDNFVINKEENDDYKFISSMNIFNLLIKEEITCIYSRGISVFKEFLNNKQKYITHVSFNTLVKFYGMNAEECVKLFKTATEIFKEVYQSSEISKIEDNRGSVCTRYLSTEKLYKLALKYNISTELIKKYILLSCDIYEI